MRIYLAGPMRGHPDLNRPKFKQAATALREGGHFVWNPAEQDDATDAEFTFATCMRRDLLAILTECDTIVLLPGWEKSEGATLEMHVAHALGYPIYAQQEGTPTDVPPAQENPA